MFPVNVSITVRTRRTHLTDCTHYAQAELQVQPFLNAGSVEGHGTHKRLPHWRLLTPQLSLEQGPVYPCDVGSGSAAASPAIVDAMMTAKRMLTNGGGR
jgi:hypothetical protein